MTIFSRPGHHRPLLFIAGAVVVLALTLPPLAAAKPEGAGKNAPAGKAKSEPAPTTVDQASPARGKAKAEAEAKETAEETRLRGFDAVAARKAEQERKELGKGSEQGQAKRAEKSRKWWKFWGGEKPEKPETPPPPAP